MRVECGWTRVNVRVRGCCLHLPINSQNLRVVLSELVKQVIKTGYFVLCPSAFKNETSEKVLGFGTARQRLSFGNAQNFHGDVCALGMWGLNSSAILISCHGMRGEVVAKDNGGGAVANKGVHE